MVINFGERVCVIDCNHTPPWPPNLNDQAPKRAPSWRTRLTYPPGVTTRAPVWATAKPCCRWRRWLVYRSICVLSLPTTLPYSSVSPVQQPGSLGTWSPIFFLGGHCGTAALTAGLSEKSASAHRPTPSGGGGAPPPLGGPCAGGVWPRGPSPPPYVCPEPPRYPVGAALVGCGRASGMTCVG